MINYSILKEASNLESQLPIKVAGVVNRLFNWFKQLTSKEYRAQVDRLRGESVTINNLLPELSKHVELLQQAISDADVDSYDKELQEVQFLSNSLTRELQKLNETASEISEKNVQENISAKTEVPVETTEEKTEQIDNSDRESGLINKPFRNVDFLNKLPLVFNENAKQKIKSDLITLFKDSSNDYSGLVHNSVTQDNFILFLEEAIKNGTVLTVSPLKKENRTEQNHVEILTAPFSIPNVSVKFKANVLLNEVPNKVLSFVRIKKLQHELFVNASIRKKELIKLAVYNSVVSVPGLEKKSPEFINKLIDLGNELNIDPSFLASVMSVESRLNAEATNSMGGATGLIQFMPSTLRNYNITPEQLRSLSDVDQLEYVKKFFTPWAGKIKSAEDLYMATFLPIFVGKPPETIIAQKGNHNPISSEKGLTYDRVYKYNAGFDTNKDGIITVSDVGNRVNRAYNQGAKIGRVYENQTPSVAKYTKDESYKDYSEEEINELFSFLNKADDSLENIVKTAILKQILPKNKIAVNIYSEAEDFVKVKYAQTIQNVLNEINFDSNIYVNNDEILLSCTSFGNLENNKNIIKTLCSLTSKYIKDKYKVKIATLIEEKDITNLKKVSSINDSNILFFNKFATDVTFSSTMRDLNKEGDKDKLLKFLKTFKDNFDKNYIDGLENCDIKALSQTLGK